MNAPLSPPLDPMPALRAALASPPARRFPGRSVLYSVFRQHFDIFAHAIEAHDVGWVELALAANDAGLLNSKDGPVDRKTTRRVWSRVVRDVTRLRAKPTGRPVNAIAPPPSPQYAPVSSPAIAFGGSAERPRPVIQIVAARPIHGPIEN